MYGQELYPDIYKKAACYAFFIIKNHIFYDGNKRTGMKCSQMFLELNGMTLNKSVSDDKIVELALRLAQNTLSLEDLADFFKKNTTEFLL